MALDTYADLSDEDLNEVADRPDAVIPNYCGRFADDQSSLADDTGPLNCSNSVELRVCELRGIEPLTFSMRTSPLGRLPPLIALAALRISRS